MPQLDVATFIGQVSWFVVVFAAYYIITTTDILPSFNRAVKARMEKLQSTRGDSRQFDGFRESAAGGFDSAASVGSGRSLGVLSLGNGMSLASARAKFGSAFSKGRPQGGKRANVVSYSTAGESDLKADAKLSGKASSSNVAKAKVEAPKASAATSARKTKKSS